MSVLATVSKPQPRPPIMTICCDAGTGKTSLAATFPNPIFIRAEDGLASVPADVRPDAFPLLQTADDLWPQLLALLQEEHSYNTIVIDSVSALETLFIKSILDSDGRAKGLNQALGGYGNGQAALTAMHSRVRKAAGLLNERKGMNVVFISHADLETMRLPDSDDYSRYSLRLNSKSLPPFVDDVDLVAFVRLVSALRGDEGDRKKIISNGDRELVCHATAASVSKNRYGITDALDCPAGSNPLLELLPVAGIAAQKKAKPTKATQEPETPVDADVDPADFTTADFTNEGIAA